MNADLLLRRALERSADAAAVLLTIRHSAMTTWASATFAGARHEIVLELAGTAADRWLGGLPEANLPLSGHLVADLKIVAIIRANDAVMVTVEVLTVEDC